jgi:ABC-type siderophore export system fused ATPase/permease subunit
VLLTSGGSPGKSWRRVFALIVLGGIGYRVMVARAFHRLTFARAEEDRLFGYFRALTEGIKELKLHRRRRTAFYQISMTRPKLTNSTMSLPKRASSRPRTGTICSILRSSG